MAQAQADFPNRLRYRHIAIAVLIVLFAFALRSVHIYQRALNDPSFIPRPGTDHYRYLNNAQLLLNGDWPTQPHYFHPAPSYVFAAIFFILGNTSFVLLTFVIALIDSLTVGWMIAGAFLLTKRAWPAYVCGLIYSLYPVAIFYASTPLIAPLASFLIALFLLLIFWQKANLTWWRSILLGLVAGAIALSRLNLLPVVTLYYLWLWLLGLHWRKILLHSALFSFFMIALISPITWHNYRSSGGAFIPVATTGAQELYMANNRDSAGRHGQTPAHQAIDMPYLQAIIRDAQVAPEHFFGLLAYKFALFWSAIEPGNNLTFEQAQDASSLLQMIPLNFTWLLVAGLFGLAALRYHNRETAIVLGLMLAWMCFSYVLTFAFGRIRFPAVIPLILLSSFLLFAVAEAIRKDIQWRDFQRRYRFVIIGIVFLVGFSFWVLYPETKLPPKRTYNELPADAIAVNARFEDVILRGWRPIAAWPAAADGWVPVYEAYGIELFWQLAQPTNTEYLFFIGYIDDGIRYDAIDQPIGAISFPAYTTQKWDTNTIYGEIVSLRLDDDVPQERSGQIRVGVWYWEEGQIVNVSAANGDANILLQSLAEFNPPQTPDAPDLPASDFVFGDLIALRGYAMPETAAPDETLILSFYWEALQNINSNYTVLLHVQDEAGNVVAQGDNLPTPGLYTSNWAPHYPLLGQLPLTMPSEPGNYTIYLGLYNETGRLPTDTPDDRVVLGTITVE